MSELQTNQCTLCVLVGERRMGGGIWPVVTINLPENGEPSMTGRKSAHLAVPVLKRALMAAELQVAGSPLRASLARVAMPVATEPADTPVRAPLEVLPPMPDATEETTLYSAGDGY